MARTETMSLSDFMSGNYGAKKKRAKAKKTIKKYAPVAVRVLITVGSAIVFNEFVEIPAFADGCCDPATTPTPSPSVPANAPIESISPDNGFENYVDKQIYERILKAFEPVVFLVKAISYPIASIVALGGGLFFMIGNRERGFAMIQQAGIGYIIVQMVPLLMKLLAEIASHI